MKRMLLTALAAAALLFTAGTASAITISDYQPGQPANGIVNSRHNMGALGKVITSPNTTEVCIFCHTPHHTNTSYTVVPLWNRKVQNPSVYTAYGTTMAGSSITTVGSTSLACLSCHDGLTTFDAIVNAPGKGGITVGGADQNWAFQMPIPMFGLPSTVIDHFNTSVMVCGSCHQHATADRANNILRLNIGNKGATPGFGGATAGLTDDHPVGVVYQEKTASLRPLNTNISQVPINAGINVGSSPYAANINQNLWAVKGYFNTSATISDLLRGPNRDQVECTSCHDPHFSNKSWDEVEGTWIDRDSGGTPLNIQQWCGGIDDGINYTPPSNPELCSDGNFLRRVGGNTASGVCRTCHNK